MKKLLLAVLIITSLNCKKSSSDIDKICYRCTFGATVNSVIPPPRTVCIYPWESIPEFQDANGNVLNAWCVKQ